MNKDSVCFQRSLIFSSIGSALIGMGLPTFSSWAFVSFLCFLLYIGIILQKVNKIIPIKELFCLFMILQMLIGPAFAYNGFEDYLSFYSMKVDEDTYYSYVMPAVFAFLFGVNFFGKKADLNVNIESLKLQMRKHKKVPFYLIIIGFGASYIFNYLPSELRFVGYLVACFKYVGLFYLLLAGVKLHLKWFVLIYGSILVSSFTAAMFHDLMIWTIFLGFILAIKFKPTFIVKMTGIVAFILLAIFIQSIKGELRRSLWAEEQELSLDLLEEVSTGAVDDDQSFLSKDNLGKHITRINQGHIIASIMRQVPEREEHTRGYLTKAYMEAAFLPRALAPNKLQAGNKEIFNKYSGYFLRGNTSMGLSSVGDAYIEFGIFGGWIYMFSFGLLFSFALSRINKLNVVYPALPIFALVLFLYPVRPDCETQTLLGHFFKAMFLTWLIFRIYRKYFKMNSERYFSKVAL